MDNEKLYESIYKLNEDLDDFNRLLSELKRHVIAKAGSDTILSDVHKLNYTNNNAKRALDDIIKITSCQSFIEEKEMEEL